MFSNYKYSMMKKTALTCMLAMALMAYSSCAEKAGEKTDVETRLKEIPQPGDKIVALMIDAPRTMDKPVFYRKYVDFCKQWGYNAIFLRLTDDQGSAYRFESHPELITHKNALDREELSALIAYAEEQGILLIPEIETFGHTRYITAVDEHAYLDDSEAEPDIFNAISPVKQESLTLMNDLISEVAELFPGPYLHIGCDEVNWGAHPDTKKALESKSKDQLWAEYVNQLNAMVRGHGKEAIIWGDMVTRHHTGTIELLDKNIIILDWIYWDDEPSTMIENGRKLLDAGFRIMGGPAVNFCAWGPRVNIHQFRNIQAFRKAHASLGDGENILGTVVTNWLPARFLPNGQWDSYAVGAMILNSDTSFVFMDGLQLFFSRHYGVQWTDQWEDLLKGVYQHAPPREGCGRDLEPRTMYQAIVWQNKEDIIELLQDSVRENPYTSLAERMKVFQAQVTRNVLDYNDMTLSFEYLSHILWRKNQVIEAKTKTREEIGAVIAEIALRDSLMLIRLDESWDRARPENSPLKTDYLIYNRPQDALLATMRKASHYSAQLANEPDLLLEILKD